MRQVRADINSYTKTKHVSLRTLILKKICKLKDKQEVPVNSKRSSG